MAPVTEAPRVLLLESHRDPASERARLFAAPERVICCRHPAEVQACLREAEQALAAGHYVAGFLGYEAGYGLQPKLQRIEVPPTTEHVLWLGVFAECQQLQGPAVARYLAGLGGAPGASVSELSFDQSRAQHRENFQRIQAYLRAGDSYQVCQSLRARFQVRGSAAALFQRLRAEQVTAFSAFIDTTEYSVLSLSPELFFRKTQGKVELKPMKGTAAPGKSATDDAAIAEAMRADPKTRAENVMIVDLLRSDIGRLAKPGTVRVPELFSVERFETVLQMTSSIVAEVEPQLGLAPLMQALFPSGSVTGAPKLRTMEIIHELEPSPRGIFCGSIGYAAPNGDMAFNVAIRSLVVDAQGQGTLGIGSGVVVDSTSDSEYDECLLKARFLASAQA